MALFNINLEEHEDKIELVRHYQKYLYITVVLVVAVQLFFVIVKPKWEVHRQNTNVLSEYRTIFKARKSRVMDQANIQKELANLEKEVKAQQGVFFTEKQQQEFSLHTVSKMASSYGNKVNYLNYSTPTPLGKSVPLKALQNRLFVYPISMNLEGDFLGLLNFFNELEKYEHIVKVMSFATQRKSVDPLVLSTQLSLSLYVMK